VDRNDLERFNSRFCTLITAEISLRKQLRKIKEEGRLKPTEKEIEDIKRDCDVISYFGKNIQKIIKEVGINKRLQRTLTTSFQ